MTDVPSISDPDLSGRAAGSLTVPRRPVLRYHGGKWRIADWVISHFPPHEVYIEAFGGAASVLMNKAPSRIEVYNDLNAGVVNLFRILRDPTQADALRRLVELTPFSRDEFEACWEVCDDAIEEARRLIVRSFQSIGNKDRLSRNGWRTRTAKSHWSPCVAWNGWPDAIPAYVQRLKDAIIENLTWQEIVNVYDHENTLFYLDPPYVFGARSNGHTKVYAHEMSDADHLELLERLQAVKGMVVLSGYHHPMYDAALQGWPHFETEARAQTNSPRREVVWLNPAASRRQQSPGLGLTESGNNPRQGCEASPGRSGSAS